jgi:hypothetical protein
LTDKLLELKAGIGEVRQALIDYCFNCNHWDSSGCFYIFLGLTGRHDQTVNPELSRAAASRLLDMFVRVREGPAQSVLDMVSALGSEKFESIPGNPNRELSLTATQSDERQHVPDLFKSSGKMTRREFEFDADVKQVFGEFASMWQSGQLQQDKKFHFARDDPGWDRIYKLMINKYDLMFAYSDYLMVLTLLKSVGFHERVAGCLANITDLIYTPVNLKGFTRLEDKTKEYEHDRKAKPCAASVKDIGRGCGKAFTHDAIVDAHAALVHEFGADDLVLTKDRRSKPNNRDVLCVVRHSGVLWEVQLAFNQVFPLKAFSHVSYDVLRPEVDNIAAALSTIFDIPANKETCTVGLVHMTEFSRLDTSLFKCKLHF